MVRKPPAGRRSRSCRASAGGTRNPWADHVVVTGVGHARNLAVAASGDAVIAVGGSWGTVAEIAFAMRLGRPVVVVDGGPPVDGVPRAATAEAAVDAIVTALAGAVRQSAAGRCAR